MMKSGWHAVWDARMAVLEREWLWRELAGVSYDGLVAIELVFRQKVTEAAERIGKALAPLAKLLDEVEL